MNTEVASNAEGFHRGWSAVAAAALAMCVGYIPVIGFTFTVLFKAISSEFTNWDRSEISLAFSLSLIALSLVLPGTGRLVDRFGARKVILPGTILFGIGLMSFRLLTGHLWQFYLLFVFLGVTGTATVTMPYYKVICAWFVEKRAIALGIATVGGGLGSALLPYVAYSLISKFGWRQAYFVMGLSVLAIAIPAVALLLKEKPAHVRPQLDEVPTAKSDSEAGASSAGVIWHSKTFWLVGASFFLMSVTINGCLVHLVPLLTDRGAASKDAVFATSVFGAATLLGNLGAGYFLDRVTANSFAAGIFGLAAVGIFLLWQGAAGSLVLVAVLFMGFGMGTQSVVMPYVVSRYFGLGFFGEIFGFVLTIYTIGAILGPMMMGAVFDSAHSYSLALGGFVLAALLAAGLMKWLAPNDLYPAAVSGAAGLKPQA